MYNAMLHPVTRYTIRGFAWNQGEANVGRHKEYVSHLADMVKIWRDEWGLGDLPFYSVEIPAWHYNDPDGTSAALLREAQRESVRIIPNSKIISTVDLIYPREYYDIHGSKKKKSETDWHIPHSVTHTVLTEYPINIRLSVQCKSITTKQN